MIIDIHTHLAKESGTSVEAILAEARRMGISRLVNLGSAPLSATPEQVVSANDRTLQLAQQHSDMIIGFCRLNPTHEKRFLLQEITRCIENGNLKGIKLSVERNARSPQLDPILEACARLNVPVLYHAWYKTIGKAMDESTPADIADLARRHPGVTLIMAHLTAGGIRGVLDIQPYPNVYVDTSGSQPFSGIIEYALEALGAERILYGSDMPIRDFSCQLGRVYGANISRQARDRILGRNAKELLSL